MTPSTFLIDSPWLCSWLPRRDCVRRVREWFGSDSFQSVGLRWRSWAYSKMMMDQTCELCCIKIQHIQLYIYIYTIYMYGLMKHWYIYMYIYIYLCTYIILYVCTVLLYIYPYTYSIYHSWSSPKPACTIRGLLGSEKGRQKMNELNQAKDKLAEAGRLSSFTRDHGSNSKQTMVDSTKHH